MWPREQDKERDSSRLSGTEIAAARYGYDNPPITPGKNSDSPPSEFRSPATIARMRERLYEEEVPRRIDELLASKHERAGAERKLGETTKEVSEQKAAWARSPMSARSSINRGTLSGGSRASVYGPGGGYSDSSGIDMDPSGDRIPGAYTPYSQRGTYTDQSYLSRGAPGSGESNMLSQSLLERRLSDSSANFESRSEAEREKLTREKKEHEKLAYDLAQANDRVNTQEQQIQTLEMERDLLQSQADNSKQRMKELEQQMTAIENAKNLEVERLRAEGEYLQEELHKALTDQAGDADDKLVGLEQRLAHYEQLQRESQATVTQLSNEKTHLERESQATIAQLTHEKTQLESIYEKMHADVNHAQVDLHHQMEKYAELERQYIELANQQSARPADNVGVLQELDSEGASSAQIEELKRLQAAEHAWKEQHDYMMKEMQRLQVEARKAVSSGTVNTSHTHPPPSRSAVVRFLYMLIGFFAFAGGLAFLASFTDFWQPRSVDRYRLVY